MKMIKKKDLFKDILFAAFLAIIFVSTIFISQIISYKNEMWFIYELFIALLYGFALISNKISDTIFKWLFSLPLSYMVFEYFWTTEYAVRGLNWVFPYYGESSAGGNFAGFIQLCVLLFVCGISMVVAFTMTSPDKIKKYRSFEKIQMIVCGVLGVVVVLTVIILEQQFPKDYNHDFMSPTSKVVGSILEFQWGVQSPTETLRGLRPKSFVE